MISLFKSIQHEDCIEWQLIRKDPLAECDALVEINKFKESLKPGPWIFDKSAVVMFHGPIRTGYRSHVHEYNNSIDNKCVYCKIEGYDK